LEKWYAIGREMPAVPGLAGYDGRGSSFILAAIWSDLLGFTRYGGTRGSINDIPRFRGNSERNCDPEGKIMTVFEASKSANARTDGLAALHVKKTACSSSSPMSQLARIRTGRPSEISFLAEPTLIETSLATAPRKARQ